MSLADEFAHLGQPWKPEYNYSYDVWIPALTPAPGCSKLTFSSYIAQRDKDEYITRPSPDLTFAARLQHISQVESEYPQLWTHVRALMHDLRDYYKTPTCKRRLDQALDAGSFVPIYLSHGEYEALREFRVGTRIGVDFVLEPITLGERFDLFFGSSISWALRFRRRFVGLRFLQSTFEHFRVFNDWFIPVSEYNVQ